MNATYFAQSPETLSAFRKQSLTELIDDLRRIWTRITKPYIFAGGTRRAA